MRIVVYPHSMEIGGSQLNALELAAAVRDRGHEVLVYSEPGPLVGTAAQLGLESVIRATSRLNPGPATALDLRRLVRERGIDVVHGYEWPPILESYAATSAPGGPGGAGGPGGPASTVGTVMSMAIAPFLPASVPLFVGTERLRALTSTARRGPVVLMEPPVDTVANRPGGHAEAFRAAYPAPAGVAQVVVVSRLATELKLEGILTAVRAVGEMARHRPVRLVVVGDGPARPDVEAAAAEANQGLTEPAVVLTGELRDPRGAYDAADVCLGMGGSALRALAFAAPLVVQGEGGFFETLTPDSVGRFLQQGWYGVADRDPASAVAHLRGLLDSLLDDPGGASRLGAFGRRLIEDRFSLELAAECAEHVYLLSRGSRAGAVQLAGDALASGAGLGSYKLRRRWEQVQGRRRRDDFNAKPL